MLLIEKLLREQAEKQREVAEAVRREKEARLALEAQNAALTARLFAYWNAQNYEDISHAEKAIEHDGYKVFPHFSPQPPHPGSVTIVKMTGGYVNEPELRVKILAALLSEAPAEEPTEPADDERSPAGTHRAIERERARWARRLADSSQGLRLAFEDICERLGVDVAVREETDGGGLGEPHAVWLERLHHEACERIDALKKQEVPGGPDLRS